MILQRVYIGFQFGVANMGLGLVAHLSGRYGESVERYEQASAAMPGDPWLRQTA